MTKVTKSALIQQEIYESKSRLCKKLVIKKSLTIEQQYVVSKSLLTLIINYSVYPFSSGYVNLYTQQAYTIKC